MTGIQRCAERLLYNSYMYRERVRVSGQLPPEGAGDDARLRDYLAELQREWCSRHCEKIEAKASGSGTLDDKL